MGEDIIKKANHVRKPDPGFSSPEMSRLLQWKLQTQAHSSSLRLILNLGQRELKVPVPSSELIIKTLLL